MEDAGKSPSTISKALAGFDITVWIVSSLWAVGWFNRLVVRVQVLDASVLLRLEIHPVIQC